MFQLTCPSSLKEVAMNYRNLFVVSLLFSQVSFASTNTTIVTTEPINVDGYMTTTPATDHEMETIKSEIVKQKKEIVLNKEKSKGFRELSKSTSQLADVTSEYIEEKKAAQAEIAEYNTKVRCLQEENPGKDCEKYTRRRK
jgi:hypothetical protein